MLSLTHNIKRMDKFHAKKVNEVGDGEIYGCVTKIQELPISFQLT